MRYAPPSTTTAPWHYKRPLSYGAKYSSIWKTPPPDGLRVDGGPLQMLQTTRGVRDEMRTCPPLHLTEHERSFIRGDHYRLVGSLVSYQLKVTASLTTRMYVFPFYLLTTFSTGRTGCTPTRQTPAHSMLAPHVSPFTAYSPW